MVLFDLVSPFTNVPLEETINIIIKIIHDKNEINTNIQKQEMKELLYLCTKYAHFILNSKTYVQIDGGVMGLHYPLFWIIFLWYSLNKILSQHYLKIYHYGRDM